MHVQIVLFDGFDPLDVIAPYGAFALAGRMVTGGLTVELASAQGPRAVMSGVGGFALRATARLDPDQADIVFVPGACGAGGTPESLGNEVPVASLDRALGTELPGLLRRALAMPRTTVAVAGSSAQLLALAGLTGERLAGTHRRGAGWPEATGGRPVDRPIVDHGKLVMAEGMTAGYNLSRYLLERELGEGVPPTLAGLLASVSHEAVRPGAGSAAVSV